MKRSRFTEDQIIGVLKEHQAGIPTAELCRKHGISEATFYNWRNRYGGMEVSDVRRLKSLEEENRRLKKLVPSRAVLKFGWRDLQHRHRIGSGGEVNRVLCG